MSIESKIKAVIGDLHLALMIQAHQTEDAQAQLVASYEMLSSCIRSDQLSVEQVQKVMQDAAFKQWYVALYPVSSS